MDNLKYSINEIKKVFEYYYKVNPSDKIMHGIKLCDELNLSFSFTKLRLLYLHVNQLLSLIPNEQYKSHLYISNKIRVIYIHSILQFEFSNQEFAQLYIDLSSIFTWLTLTISQNGIPGEAYNQLMVALNPFTDTFYDREVKWMQEHWRIAIDVYKIAGARETLMLLMASYFYLSRILAHNYKESHLLFEETNRWLKEGEEAEYEDIEYLCFYSGVLASNPNQKYNDSILEILKKQYDVEKKRNHYFAFRIAETLARKFGRLAGEDISDWAKKALSYNIDLPVQERVILSITVLLNEDNFNKNEVFRNLLSYLNYLNEQYPDKLQNINQRQRLSDIINMIVISAVERKEYRFAFKCAYYWKTYFNKKSVKPLQGEIVVLVISNYLSEETIFLIWHKGEIKFLRLNREIKLKDLISIKNRFEGTWTILANEEEPIQNYEDDELGIQYSFQYEKNIEDYYQIDSLKRELEEILDGEKIRIFELSWTNSPMMNILARKMEYGNSILESGSILEQRDIKKVLIWCDPDGSLEDARLESEAIQSILLAKDITSIIYTFEECSKELFLKEYENDEYDVIWLMCHGKFNSDEPNDSFLKISATEYVSVSELSAITPKTEKRRLLVLNACESGSSAIRYDAMGFSGFGASLSNEAQSVIGHLWPVSSIAAGIFGFLLMDFLTSEEKWEDSINKARILLSLNSSEIMERLSIYEEIDPFGIELFKIVEQEGMVFEELFFWGSPCLFQ